MKSYDPNPQPGGHHTRVRAQENWRELWSCVLGGDCLELEHLPCRCLQGPEGCSAVTENLLCSSLTHAHRCSVMQKLQSYILLQMSRPFPNQSCPDGIVYVKKDRRSLSLKANSVLADHGFLCPRSHCVPGLHYRRAENTVLWSLCAWRTTGCHGF